MPAQGVRASARRCCSHDGAVEHVALDQDRPPAQRPDLGDDGLGLRRVLAVVDGHVRPGPGQFQGAAAADAAGRAGDQGFRPSRIMSCMATPIGNGTRKSPHLSKQTANSMAGPASDSTRPIGRRPGYRLWKESPSAQHFPQDWNKSACRRHPAVPPGRSARFRPRSSARALPGEL